ncbi:MAG: extracellular solute-binding protein [Oscillospiraceae bacterium]|nr:extracellular solute-binding protein [Oscillospiraceae bacterium]
MVWKRRAKQTTAVFMAFALFWALPARGYAPGDMSREEYQDIIEVHTIDESIPPYSEYLRRNPVNRPDVRAEYSAADFARYETGGAETAPQIIAVTGEDGRGFEGVLTEEDSVIELEIDVPQSGLYDLSIRYFPIAGKSSAIQRSLFVNGVLPYRELATLEFQRVWSNRPAVEATSAGLLEPVWQKDNQGNDIKPTMVEIPQWMDSYLYDSEGYFTGRLSLYFEQGKNTVAFFSLREPMLIHSLMISNEPYPPSYAEALAGWERAGARDAAQAVSFQAQNAARTSSQMLYPVQDQSSPAVNPASPRHLLNNTIGGFAWRSAGQWIEWDFDAPEAGLYELSVHVRQNFTRGIYMSRKISVNGVVPFAEFEDYGFVHRQTWRMETLASHDGEPYKIYLNQGRNTLRMEAVLGSLGEAVGDVRAAVYQLNAIYRRVIRLTGVAPDRHRDYQINRSLPGLRAEMTDARDRLQRALDMLEQAAGRRSDRERVLKTMVTNLTELIEDPEKFPRQVSSFRVNIRACGTWLTQAVEQPIALDMISFHPAGEAPKAEGNSFFHRFWFEMRRLFYSFIIDYNQIGNVSDAKGSDTITLWIGSGRDQASVIKTLIDETFTPIHSINVNVMMMDMSTLLQATLAGQGPDVAVQVPFDLPMNFGLRNAVYDLTGFDDLTATLGRFRPSIMEAYSYGGKVFALPETQTFPMMFYRKDILREIGLDVPDTWDEMKIALAVLANHEMELGMLPREPIFSMLLYQNEGAYYNEDATRSALDSDEAFRAFKMYTEFYTEYKLDKDTSPEERFRTGETPIIIQDYLFYNTLQISAPDIKGLWGFSPVPGTVMPDGSVNRAVGSYGSATIMMNDTESPEQAWEFLKWWTSVETQTLFGREMESLMGPAARHPSANIEAFSLLPWPVADYQALTAQFEHVRGIPQVPGGYFSFRNINNAFYAVVTGRSVRGATADVFESPREALTDKVILINDEIDFKRKELGLPLYSGREGR